MVNLNDHIKNIEGEDYVPLKLVKQLLENSTVSKSEYLNNQAQFDDAMKNLEKYIKEVTTDINKALKDD